MGEARPQQEMKEHLQRIAQDVFSLMTEIELKPCSSLGEPLAPVAAKLCYRNSAGVELELMCESSLALAATQRLMSLDCVPDEADGMVKECVGELVNMVGGNFYSILSPGSALDTTPVLMQAAAKGRRVRIESFLGGAEGRLRLRLTETAHQDPTPVLCCCVS